MPTHPHELSLSELQTLARMARATDKKVQYLNLLATRLRETDSTEAIACANDVVRLLQQRSARRQSRQQEEYFELQQAQALATLCYALRSTERVADAEEYGNQAITIFERYQKIDDAATVRYTMAYILLCRHQLAEALQIYRECSDIFEQTGNDRMFIAATAGMANVLARQGAYAQAVEYFRQCIRETERLGLHADQAAHCVGLGNLYQHQSHFEQALSCYRQSISITKTLNTKRVTAAALVGIAGICKITGNYPLGIHHAEEALELFRLLGNSTGMATTLELLSGMYLDHGEYARSLSTTLAIAREIEGAGYSRMLGGVYNNIGASYAAHQEYDKSISYFTKALGEYTTSNDERGKCFTNSNLAEQYLVLHRLEQAQFHIQAALDIARKYHFIDLEIEILPVYSRVLLASNGAEPALKALGESLAHCHALGHKRGIAKLSIAHGNLLLHLARIFETEAMYHGALECARGMNDAALESEAHKALAELYERLNDTRRALHHHKEFHALDKQMFNQDSQRNIANLQVLYETQAAEKERDMYRIENDKLHLEKELATKELSAMALHLVQKNEMLETLRRKAREIVESYAEESRLLAREMVRQIEGNIRDDSSWESFNRQFTKLHSDFTHILSEKFPTLTPMELKICALLKIQLTSKEIAAALVISPRTVEDHRNRMRKKFGLAKDANLSTFLASL